MGKRDKTSDSRGGEGTTSDGWKTKSSLQQRNSSKDQIMS